MIRGDERCAVRVDAEPVDEPSSTLTASTGNRFR